MDVDAFINLFARLSTDINVNDILGDFYKLPSSFKMIETERKRVVLPLDKKIRHFEEIRNTIESLTEWIEVNKEINEE